MQLSAPKHADAYEENDLESTIDESLHLESCEIVIVCWNSCEPLLETLGFLRRTGWSPFVVPITIVNNSQHDAAEMSAICARFDARLVQTSMNLGFGTASNIGATHCVGDLILFLSPGCLISIGSIETMARSAAKLPSAVGFGPVNCSKNGRLSFKTKALRIGLSNRSILDRYNARRKEIIKTSFLSGGSMMIRRSAFATINGFDQNIFLFHEDDDLSIRLSKLGSLYYITSAQVLHAKNINNRRDKSLRVLRAWHLGHSFLYVMRKHHGSAGVALTSLVASRRFLNPAYLISSRYREKTNYFFKGFLSSLKRYSAHQGLKP